MKLRVKIGTMSGTYVEAPRLRKPPKVGQRITIRPVCASERSMYGEQLIVMVDNIEQAAPHEPPLYFVTRW